MCLRRRARPPARVSTSPAASAPAHGSRARPGRAAVPPKPAGSGKRGDRPRGGERASGRGLAGLPRDATRHGDQPARAGNEPAASRNKATAMAKSMLLMVGTCSSDTSGYIA